jgi:hypothetical protein
MKQATAAGGDMLIVVLAETEEIAEFVVASTEALGRAEALEPAHASCAPFDAAVTLLESVILVPLVRCTTRRPSTLRIARG